MDTTPQTTFLTCEPLLEEARARVQEITIVEVEKALSSNETVHLIDVRDRDEFDQGHLIQAQHLSKGWIEMKITQQVLHSQEKIILYCGSGRRSLLAADNLQKMGYTCVYSMQGGIKAWLLSGRAVVR